MSSSSSSSSGPPLPAELVLHILHLSYPPHAEDDYIGRSGDVLQCCLVSKQWKELAEPVLWRSVTITCGEQVDQLAQQPDAKHLRSLSLSGTQYYHLDTATLPRLQAFRLPHFKNYNDAPTLLNLAATPALRHLHANFLHAEPNPERLIDLLDIAERPISQIGRIANASSPSRLRYPPCHLRFNSSHISWSILDNIFLLPHRPESLFLPLLPPSSTDASTNNNSAREAFLKRCKDEGVDVRWYRPAKEEWREVGCREFREYVEERERRAEA
ncbi:hypothetical protein JCM8097_005741 [Rhodosporidiobolus ruineniae]